jgi:hypothetical protein
MTSIWGPLGWMTLHSVASCYPDTPTQSEIALSQTWLDMFQTTITCPSCKEHFGIVLAAYRRLYPQMLASRSDFLVFTFRAHNAVNRRLNKPIYPTVASCFEALRLNVKSRSAREYRTSYLGHIQRFWRTMQDASGFTALKRINEMVKIENEYVHKRENNFEVDIPETNVVLANHLLSSPTEEPSPIIHIDTRSAPLMGLRGGRFQIRR